MIQQWIAAQVRLEDEGGPASLVGGIDVSRAEGLPATGYRPGEAKRQLVQNRRLRAC